jgi:hypothetical protein
MKRSLKLLRFQPSIHSSASDTFHSVADGIIVAACNDSNYKELMNSLYTWVDEIEKCILTIKQSDMADM